MEDTVLSEKTPRVSGSPASSRTRRRLAPLARETAVFVFFLLAAIQFTWPLAIRLSTLVSDASDPLLNTWILDWVMHAATHSGASIVHAPIFHPARYALAFSENLYGIALVMLPLRAAGLSPLEIYNAASLLGFAFSAYGCWVLCRLLTGSVAASLIGGLLYGFIPFRFDHVSHLQHVWGGWLPILFAALIWYCRQPGWWRGALFGAAFLMNGLTNIHWFLFGSVTAAVTLGLLLAMGRAGGGRRFWLPLGAATLAALIVMVPVLAPYRAASKLYKMKRGKSETRYYSATWSDWLVAPPHNRLHEGVPDPDSRDPERSLFPGLMILFLAGSGLLLTRRDDSAPSASLRAGRTASLARTPSRRLLRAMDTLIVAALVLSYFAAASRVVEWRIGGLRILSMSTAAVPFLVALVLLGWRLYLRFPENWGGEDGGSLRDVLRRSRTPAGIWIALVWVAVGVLGSLGLNGFFHGALFRLEVFRSLRVPARWSAIAYIGLATLAAYGALALMTRGGAKKKILLFALLFTLCWVELQPRIAWAEIPPEPPAVYRWLAGAPIRGAVLELPMDHWSNFEYLYRSTAHHRPLVNGTSGFEPALHAKLAEMARGERIGEQLVSKLEEIGCSLLIVHADKIPPRGAVTGDWLRRELRSGRLAFVRRFDHDVRGDWVFALTRSEPDWVRLTGEEAADPAGRSPQQNLELYLSAGEVYNRTAFGYLESPLTGEVKGPLQISGWALAPDGVKQVNILFEQGRVRVPAVLGKRSDVSAAFPWYPATETPGFSKRFETRPRGVSLETPIGIEIVDGKGRRTRLRDGWVKWFRK